MNRRVTIELPAEIAEAVVRAAESGAEIALSDGRREIGTVRATPSATPARPEPAPPSAEEIERRGRAIERLKAYRDRMTATVTTDEILEWIREGRP